MRGIKRQLVVLAAVGTAFALTPLAGAQERGTQPARTDPFLDKAEYAPGEKITIFLLRGYKCGIDGVSTSEGFTAPAKLTQGRPDDWSLSGQTTAAAQPGTYEAQIKCLTGAVVNTFVVKAPPSPTPPTTKPPGPKPPVVKPKGAPETGGGGTAGSLR